MSSLSIVIMASKAPLARMGSGSPSSSPRIVGTTCHDTP